jgi:signal transduction histidine kinase
MAHKPRSGGLSTGLLLPGISLADAAASGPAALFDRPVVGWPLLGGMCLVLVLRRYRPASTVVAAAALVLAFVGLADSDLPRQPPLEPFLVLLMTFFAVGANADERGFRYGVPVAAVLCGAVESVGMAAGRPWTDAIPSVVLWTAAIVAGRLLYRRHQEAQRERDRAETARLLGRRQAERAVEAEGTRIARELHDVIAHSLSVIMIHASVESRLQPDRSTSTAQALATIESTGREAMTELRRLLGLLRTDTAADLQPLPSLRRLDALVETARTVAWTSAWLWRASGACQ